jgi:DNA-binding transcriptional ArsR family regulator
MAKGSGILRNGRSKRKPFIMLPHSVYESAAFAKVGIAAKLVLLDLIYRHKGHNNGRLAYPVRAGERLGLSKSTTARALQELVDSGLITLERQSGFTQKTRQAAEYGLGWLPIDGRLASLGWRAAG